MEETTRLAKRMAVLGMCSRREADGYILNGWVKVNGEIIKQKGYKVKNSDKIEMSLEALEQQKARVTILLHKPVGFVSGQPEKNYRPAVQLIRYKNLWRADKSGIKYEDKHNQDLAPAGRLDIDSTGLLVLTQDGVIAKQLIGENSPIDKEYIVTVEGEIMENGLKLLNFGLSLDGKKLKPAKVTWIQDNQLRFILTEGKKRQIRRMCALVGLHVVALKRIRIGKVKLGDLPSGQWRYLSENESFE